MKLKNKKTGKIHEITQAVFLSDDMNKKFAIYSQSDGNNYAYRTLAELNEEWEDYEEPKEYWHIDFDGDLMSTSDIRCDKFVFDKLKEIGNYFKTREEAEQAVHKLKAWKQLKDKGFKFTDDLVYGEYYGCGSIKFIIFPSKEEKYVKDDLELLFGGEE